MIHRHLDTTDWTLAAIDSVLDRGDLPDWRDLFAAAAANRELAKNVLHIARAHHIRGASALACHLIKKFHPDIFDT
jgi:hypothetical protein